MALLGKGYFGINQLGWEWGDTTSAKRFSSIEIALLIEISLTHEIMELRVSLPGWNMLLFFC